MGILGMGIGKLSMYSVTVNVLICALESSMCVFVWVSVCVRRLRLS